MKFNNKPNDSVTVSGEQLWISRSVAVNGTIVAIKDHTFYILCSKRGPNAADFQGKMNLIAGYLDFDETASDALKRETWEEVGLNLDEILETKVIISNKLNKPYDIDTDPSLNRQNISLKFGLIFNNPDKLPKLSIDNNEVEGEVEDPMWLEYDDIDNYEWAFNHDKIIKSFCWYLKTF